jgi:N-acetylglucosaminyldiphosphoundecaprenol N-acetyl-beta-D-mannosaminyltransferase
MNFPISLGKFSSFVEKIVQLSIEGKSHMVCVANVHMFIEAYKQSSFAKIIKQADLITPDGQPLIWALDWLYDVKQDRVSGMDLLPSLLEKMSELGIGAYFYGGTEAMKQNSIPYFKTYHPNLKVLGFHIPPFGDYDQIIEKEVIEEINSYSPSIVFVILGCPKQEKWMYYVKSKINTVMVGIGGAFPVMIGMQRRCPSWMQKFGLEWLYRLSQEPIRLFKRYLFTNSLFIFLFLKTFLNKKIVKTIK